MTSIPETAAAEPVPVHESRDAQGIVTLTLSRPERLNALSRTMTAALVEAITRLGADPGVRVIALTGAGRAFCAGGDMKAMAGRTERSFETRVADLREAHAAPLAIARVPKPVVACLNGVAVGAGLSLALACDFRLAKTSTRLVAGFAGVALSGDWGAAWWLPRLVGGARAKEIMMLDRPVEAPRAQQIGLVTEVFDDDAYDAGVVDFLQRLAAAPTTALGYMKQNLLAAETQDFAELLDREATHVARTGMADDHREALAAFAQKRKPVFTGR